MLYSSSPARAVLTQRKHNVVHTIMVKVVTPVDFKNFYTKILTSAKKMISSERASQGEQNGANFSFITPSSEEYKDHKE